MKTCTVEGCTRKHVAKGLCGGHYNRTKYTSAQRHPKQLVPCTVCGKEVLKPVNGKRYRPTCSYECRYVLTWGKPKPQPSRELIGPMPPTCAVPPVKPQPTRGTRFLSVNCRWCGRPFVHDLRVTGAEMLYCSRRCARARSKADRKARERGASGTYTLAEVVRLWIALGKCCAYCEQPTDGLPDPDHVTPLSRGGSNSITNILPSCRPCNTDKSDMTPSEWAADRERRGLPPRLTAWSSADIRARHLVPNEPTQPRWRDISRAA